MGSIVLDEIKVKNNVIPNLSRTKTIMQDAYSTCNTLKNSLPSSFSSRSMVSSIATKIASSEKKVTDVYNNLNYKMDYVKRIESKTESKVSSLASTASKIGTSLGMLTGAVVGSAGGVVGTAVGAATGAVVGKATGEVVGKIVETGAKVVKSVVSGVKNVVVGAFNFFKDTGAKIAEGIKSIWEKAAGKVKEIATKTTEVVKTTFNKIKDTGAKVAKGVTSTVKKVVTTTKDLAVKAGTSIAKGAKSVWNSISSTAKKVGNTVKDVTTKAVKAVKNTGAKIVNGVTSTCKKLWNGAVDLGKSFINGCKKIGKSVKTWVDDKFLPGVKELAKKIGDAVTTGLKWAGTQLVRVGASIVNTVVALGEGLVSLVEALGDAVIIVGGVALSAVTALTDLVVGGLINGELTWSNTKALWADGIVKVTSYSWTDKIFSGYDNTAINKYAYSPFKRDGGIVYEITKGVGYYGGLIAASVFTAGGAGAATAAINTATAVTTGVASLGKNADKQFDKILDAAAAENRELTGGEIWKALGIAGGKAVIDGGTFYVAGAYAGKAANALSSTGIGSKMALTKVGSKILTKDGMKVTLKATKGYTSEFFDSLVTGDKFDFEAATIDAASIALAESVAIKVKPKLEKINVSFTASSSASSADGQALTSNVDDSNIKELLKGVLATSINKSEEKAVKETTSAVFESAVGLLSQ